MAEEGILRLFETCDEGVRQCQTSVQTIITWPLLTTGPRPGRTASIVGHLGQAPRHKLDARFDNWSGTADTTNNARLEALCDALQDTLEAELDKSLFYHAGLRLVD